jgi:periplasmic protein TonB
MNTMNNGDMNGGLHSQASAELEARVVAWVSGEASASESAELERIVGAAPGVAAFRSQIEAMRRLAAEAVSPDREPLRLSEERRAELMESFNAMRRRNLAFAAVFSVLLIAGVTWYGENTHFVPPFHSNAPRTILIPFTIEPDPPVPVEVDPIASQPKPPVGPPDIPDSPAPPTIDGFTVPIEPPPVVIDRTLIKIPDGGNGTGQGGPAFTLSQLDEPPVATYRARPVYPESMRRSSISGEAMVDFIVDPRGNVRNVTAVHSSQREFEEPACAAVEKWRFKPGRKDGHAVYVHMQVPIVFTLSEP